MKFMRFKWFYFLISAIVILPGLYSLFRWGLKPSIDFTGGTIIEVQWEKNISVQTVENVLKEDNIDYSSVQALPDSKMMVKTKPIDRDSKEKLIGQIKLQTNQDLVELRFETVGPLLGKELLQKTILAIILASSFILLWVWRQFKDPMYGICAILAMFHDTLVLLGVFSLLGHFYGVEVDTLFVTAVLTILSFSVHDTVVVYDRIRESKKRFSGVPFEDLVDKAVTETLSRSINNSMTIIFMLLALFLLGGSTIKWFIFALLIGTISGTYSSTFTAAPLLIVFEGRSKKK